jgi:hypothetical protein
MLAAAPHRMQRAPSPTPCSTQPPISAVSKPVPWQLAALGTGLTAGGSHLCMARVLLPRAFTTFLGPVQTESPADTDVARDHGICDRLCLHMRACNPAPLSRPSPHRLQQWHLDIQCHCWLHQHRWVKEGTAGCGLRPEGALSTISSCLAVLIRLITHPLPPTTPQRSHLFSHLHPAAACNSSPCNVNGIAANVTCSPKPGGGFTCGTCNVGYSGDACATCAGGYVPFASSACVKGVSEMGKRHGMVGGWLLPARHLLPTPATPMGPRQVQPPPPQSNHQICAAPTLAAARARQ